MECRADKGLGTTMIEEYKNSPFRDHSATSTFFHAKLLFQGQDLPPSNAARAHSEPGDPPLPSRQYHARRGSSTVDWCWHALVLRVHNNTDHAQTSNPYHRMVPSQNHGNLRVPNRSYHS
ncbi:hypothetical protein M378DRAFT_172718 [Amanita muscaria Koide BX008]|uniref:Uncharacterized protein n=1 Tax=Amanita muscaria (strain Koide BX008) TaxID=946122 RepID=A0A0C2S1C7_AMAMK|nr:hypothetical protein M378DRAFT_172718 [Amanita muscaria Koide BX008]